MKAIILFFSFMFMLSCVTASKGKHRDLSSAQNNCDFDGRAYPEGSLYGNYTCHRGQWVEGCLFNGVLYPEGSLYGNYTCLRSEWTLTE